MKLFTCSSCGQVLFFENTRCERCQHQLAYLPELNVLSALELLDQGDAAPSERTEFVAFAPEAKNARYRLCANYVQYDVCNWAIPVESDSPFCLSCALNEVIPSLDAAEATQAWARLEAAKRRLLYSLLGLGLPIDRRAPGEERGLAFAFKSSSAAENVFTGHNEGLITINIAEADDPFREKARQEMGEPYRTLLGHFRHEIGHYYWDRLISAWFPLTNAVNSLNRSMGLADLYPFILSDPAIAKLRFVHEVIEVGPPEGGPHEGGPQRPEAR